MVWKDIASANIRFRLVCLHKRKAESWSAVDAPKTFRGGFLPGSRERTAYRFSNLPGPAEGPVISHKVKRHYVVTVSASDGHVRIFDPAYG